MSDKIFQEFPEVAEASYEDLARWLPKSYQPFFLENYLANRVIYPQTIAATKDELEIDRAIFKEQIHRRPNLVLDLSAHRLILKENYVERLGPLPELVGVILEVVNPPGLVLVFLSQEERSNLVGSIVTPQAELPDEVPVHINGKSYLFKKGTINIISESERHNSVLVAGLPEIVVPGGELGVVINLKKQDK